MNLSNLKAFEDTKDQECCSLVKIYTRMRQVSACSSTNRKLNLRQWVEWWNPKWFCWQSCLLLKIPPKVFLTKSLFALVFLTFLYTTTITTWRWKISKALLAKPSEFNKNVFSNCEYERIPTNFSHTKCEVAR